jgi:hypothetical protein
MAQLSFEEAFKLGTDNEQVMILLPQFKSYDLTPLTAINMARFNIRGGPKPIGPHGKRVGIGLVCPDIEATHPYLEPCYLEFKFKSIATETEITGQKEHGISHKSYISMLRWEYQQRRQVLLVITEGDTGEVLIARFSKLQQELWTDRFGGNKRYYRPRFSDSTRMGLMAFFARNQFLSIGRVTPNDPYMRSVYEKGLLRPSLPQVENIQDVLDRDDEAA